MIYFSKLLFIFSNITNYSSQLSPNYSSGMLSNESKLEVEKKDDVNAFLIKRAFRFVIMNEVKHVLNILQPERHTAFLAALEKSTTLYKEVVRIREEIVQLPRGSVDKPLTLEEKDHCTKRYTAYEHVRRKAQHDMLSFECEIMIVWHTIVIPRIEASLPNGHKLVHRTMDMLFIHPPMKQNVFLDFSRSLANLSIPIFIESIDMRKY